MNIFKRFLRIGQAEIHAAIDKMENPIRMTEQGIREMKEDLDKAINGYAQIKAMAIRSKNELIKKRREAQDYEDKAVLLLAKAQSGEISMEHAEKLAREALILKENLQSETVKLEEQTEIHETAIADIQKNIDVLKFNITKWENELKTLKSRIRVSKATLEVNKQMALMDSNSTIRMLERMKEKVEEEEALAKAYGNVSKTSKTLDDEINILIGNKTEKVNLEIEEIKKRLGLGAFQTED